MADPEGWPINSQGEMMSAKQGKFPSIKTAQVADLIPYARNSRTHSDEQVTQNLTGKQAALEATGETFEELSNARLP